MTDPRRAFVADSGPDAASAFADTICRFLNESAAGEGPVAPVATPEQISQRFDEPLPRAGRPLREVLQRVERDVLSDSNHLSHPMYVGHQVSAPLPTGVWADALVSSLNNSLAVNEMSPTISHVERRVVRWLCDLAGWDARAGGTFTSGGTEASFTALLAARAQVMPDAWRDGVGANPPVLLCGPHTHYAVSRAAGELGLGMRNVITVPDEGYHMSPAGLRACLVQLREVGRPVLAVAATAGQTATGAFDDLDAIGAICQEFEVWLHVDGAHGASALLSSAHRHRMRGIERANSLAWDPHKMMFLPIAAGTVLVRDVRWLDAAFTQQAPYLFAENTSARWNIGVRSFQCSRRADALKVWIALQRHGADGLAAYYDLVCELTRALYEVLRAHPRFEVLHEPECNILCFRWVGVDGARGEDLNTLNAALRERYNQSGEGWITATELNGTRVLRVTIQNPRTTEAHLTRLVEGLDRHGRALAAIA